MLTPSSLWSLSVSLLVILALPTVAAGDKPQADGDCERWIQEAQEEYVHGNYDAAKAKAQKGNHGACVVKARRLIAASSCFMKDFKKAGEEWKQLPAQDRQFTSYVCCRTNTDCNAIVIKTPPGCKTPEEKQTAPCKEAELKLKAAMDKLHVLMGVN